MNLENQVAAFADPLLVDYSRPRDNSWPVTVNSSRISLDGAAYSKLRNLKLSRTSNYQHSPLFYGFVHNFIKDQSYC